MAMAASSGSGVQSSPNVTPMIDVMLVLLIIFMVTTPMMNLGVDIQLPQTEAKSLKDKKDPVVISVDEGSAAYLGWVVDQVR